jgi:hypothetical protein
MPPVPQACQFRFSARAIRPGQRFLVTPLLAAAALLWPSARFLPAAAAQQPTKVTLSQSSAPPDANVVVPVYLAAASGVRIGTLEIQVTYSTRWLTFDRAELSGLSEGVGVELATVEKEGESQGTKLVLLTLTAKRDDPAPEPIPDGPIANIVFRLAKGTEPGTLIDLVPAVSAWTLNTPPRGVQPITAPRGQIVVSTPGPVSCFFYMH